MPTPPLLLLVLSLLSAPALALAAPPSPPASAAASPTPCRLKGVSHEALCGSVRRALDPARPQGPQIDVHYAVLPAVARNKKADPVFFFAGGPGQSATELAGGLSNLLARFSNRRDIVLIDQRGTGRSAPLKCDEDDPALPLSEQFDLRRQRARLAACQASLQKLPHGDLRFYSTPIATQDADAVRAALGAQRINLVGASYGTRAALDYQRQFPQHVRRSVLDGVAPPDMALPAAFSLDNQAALDAMFASCEREAACAQRHPELRSRWRALLASLPRTVNIPHPLLGRVEPVPLTRDVLLGMVRGPLYSPMLASALPPALSQAANGQFGPLAALASALGGRRGMQLYMGMHLAVICSEDLPRLNTSVDPPGADYGISFADFYRESCATWPRGEVPAAFYTLPPAKSATLLLSGGLDPATPPRHGERAAKALGAKARHLVLAYAGHGVMSVGCMRDVIYRFVDAETDDEALKVDAACALSIPRPPNFSALEAAAR